MPMLLDEAAKQYIESIDDVVYRQVTTKQKMEIRLAFLAGARYLITDPLAQLLEAVECTARDLEGYVAGQWDGPEGFQAMAEALRLAAAKVKGGAA